MKLEKFSVLSTVLEYDKKRNTIVKKYKKNNSLPITNLKLKNLIDNYINSLTNSKIPISKIVNSYIDGEFIVYETKYSGKNIIELGFEISKFDQFVCYIKKMLLIIKKAINNNICFDPHPKNFVFNDSGEIFYVDFYPPYSNQLNTIILKSTNVNNRDIVKKNLSLFKKNFLPEHFCGDFLNIDKKSEVIFDKIYLLEKQLGITSINQKSFIKKAKYIRSVEDQRLDKNIYLL